MPSSTPTEALGHCQRCHDSFTVELARVRGAMPRPQYRPVLTPHIALVDGRLRHTPKFGCGGHLSLFGTLPHHST